MLCACIDIGSNTTRLLIAEPAGDGLREIIQQRAFTRLGTGPRRDGVVPAAKVAEVAETVATMAGLAREFGVDAVRAVGTAALRSCSNRAELCHAVTEASGVEVHVLEPDQEAALAFVGATRPLGRGPDGEVAVVDVGGGSAEIAIGRVGEGVRWSSSFRVGSGMLADAHLRSDPPSAPEMQAVRDHVRGAFEGLEIDPPALAVAVGGSATSLGRLVGPELSIPALEAGIALLCTTPIDEMAQRHDLLPERVRLLPAGLVILEQIAGVLGTPLRIGSGGLREGVILELLAGRDIAA